MSLRAFAWELFRLPGMPAVGRALYRAGVRDFVRLAASLPGTRSVAIHHGTRGDPWVPALSDVDLAVSVEDPGIPLLEALGEGYRRLSRRWPFLQEVMIASPEEWEAMAADPLLGYEVAKCETVWGHPLPEVLGEDAVRARLIRAVSLTLDSGGRPSGPGAFGRAFDARLARKIAGLCGGDLEAACRAWLEGVSDQPEARVRIPDPGPATSAGIRAALEAAPPGEVAFDPLRNACVRPVPLGPWARRFLYEVIDPLRWASAARDDRGGAPLGALRTEVLADWAAWERARRPYVLRLLALDPERLYPGFLEHQWRRGLAVELFLREGALSPGHDGLLLDPDYARFAADAASGKRDWRPHLEAALRSLRPPSGAGTRP